jgi:hypothetical protein
MAAAIATLSERRPGLDRDHQPRIGGGGDLVRDPCGFAPEQQDVGGAVAVIKIGAGALVVNRISR